MTKQSYIYILFNKRNGTLYTGVTSNLVRRIYEHKNKLADGFTKKYNVDKLGYYEIFEDINQAIKREKQIKASSRKNKLKLIESLNPEWQDLYEQIIGPDCRELKTAMTQKIT
ncbi:MAG: GIY-YIG nuclease family protein [Candidatus Gastranaerophilales bacterium]|nr:GIY-YIG nuclease family protein [Candidatus Gastranaerophilales bacterium]